jgi:hypothetical protein
VASIEILYHLGKVENIFRGCFFLTLWSGWVIWGPFKHIASAAFVQASLNETFHFDSTVQSLLHKFLINAIDPTMLQEAINFTRIPPVTMKAWPEA